MLAYKHYNHKFGALQPTAQTTKKGKVGAGYKVRNAFIFHFQNLFSVCSSEGFSKGRAPPDLYRLLKTPSL